jgi:predicted outer membrane protein
MIDDLNAAHPENFDKTYAKQQVSAHEKAEDLFSKYADKGDNQAVKALPQRCSLSSSSISRKPRS